MPQQQIPSGGPSRDSESPIAPRVSAQVSDSGVDDLLDEIDSLLEENAEAFVKSFVQKGGQ